MRPRYFCLILGRLLSQLTQGSHSVQQHGICHRYQTTAAISVFPQLTSQETSLILGTRRWLTLRMTLQATPQLFSLLCLFQVCIGFVVGISTGREDSLDIRWTYYRPKTKFPLEKLHRRPASERGVSMETYPTLSIGLTNFKIWDNVCSCTSLGVRWYKSVVDHQAQPLSISPGCFVTSIILSALVRWFLINRQNIFSHLHIWPV